MQRGSQREHATQAGNAAAMPTVSGRAAPETITQGFQGCTKQLLDVGSCPLSLGFRNLAPRLALAETQAHQSLECLRAGIDDSWLWSLTVRRPVRVPENQPARGRSFVRERAAVLATVVSTAQGDEQLRLMRATLSSEP